MNRIILFLLTSLPFFSYAQSTDTQLTTQANVIRNENAAGGNTKVRIADMYQAIINSKQSLLSWDATGTDTYAAAIGGVTAYAKTWFVINFANDNTVDDPTLNINTLGPITINANAGDLQAGIRYLIAYNGTSFDVVGAGSDVFASDVSITLSGGKTFGKYTNGQIAGWSGLTAVEAIQDAVNEYIDPVFNSFSISGQATTIEVGTTLTGSKTFTWSISANSGTVSTIDLYDVSTASTLLAGTANDGSQAQTITTVQLNSNAATQIWRGVGNNSAPVGTFNSSNFTVTSRFLRFYGPTTTSPTNSADVRALPSNAFHIGAGTFSFATGNTLIKFVIALPPSVTISQVIDTSALNADITSDWVLTGTINVLDAGSTNRSYNIYEMNIGTPYATSHNFNVTTAN